MTEMRLLRKLFIAFSEADISSNISAKDMFVRRNFNVLEVAIEFSDENRIECSKARSREWTRSSSHPRVCRNLHVCKLKLYLSDYFGVHNSSALCGSSVTRSKLDLQ